MNAWKTFLLVLDVWGLGNRGMFRTLRDLIFRPGYLICDYLNGKRSAYFPPFKLLFLLTTLSLVVGHGFNIPHENFQQNVDSFKLENAELESGEKGAIFTGLYSWINSILQFQRDYPAIFQLCFMCIAGYFFFVFFKKSKLLGKISFSEFFIALVYMVDMYIMYSTFLRFVGYFGLNREWFLPLFLLYLIPLKQMSGYSWGATVWRSFFGLLIGSIAFAAIFIGVLICAILIYDS